MSTQTQMPGGFTPFSCKISDEDAAMFKEALSPILGVDYQPVAMASQVVAGMNFAFFCNATVVVPGAPSYPAMVNIFRNLDGQASVTNIQRLPY